MLVAPVSRMRETRGSRINALPRSSGVGTNCSTATSSACVYGPCGAKIVSVTGTAPSYVFKPSIDPSVCGWQAGGTSGGFDPEPYLDQELYPNVTPTCPWTTCAGGGVPAVVLTVTAVESGATGKVESDPVGIDFAGAGSVALPFTLLEVTLRAKAFGRHTRVVFSGDCTATGDFGKVVECPLTLGPNKRVTLTYMGEPGFTGSLD